MSTPLEVWTARHDPANVIEIRIFEDHAERWTNHIPHGPADTIFDRRWTVDQARAHIRVFGYELVHEETEA